MIKDKNADNNKRLKKAIDGEKVYFASRFMPADIVCIYKTLKSLREVHLGSFAKFLKANSTSIETLAKAMYVLTYENIGQPTYKNILDTSGLDKDKIEKFADLHVKEELGKSEKRVNWNTTKFVQKRLWCAIRDLLRCKHFNEMFVKIVGKSFSIDENRKFLKDLELPGDVWNNNDSFLSCFWTIEQNQSETTELDNYKGNLPKKIRYFYNDNENLDFIPEDYDSTFEFVPRMCTKEECNACPFNMDENKVLDLCHSQKGRLCPVIKLCSGSNFNCTNPDKCPIRKYHTKL